MTTNTYLMNATEVAELLGIKKSLAYKIIRNANAKLAEAGKITVRGKVNRAFIMRLVDISDVK